MDRTISLSRRKSGFVSQDLHIDVSQLAFSPLAGGGDPSSLSAAALPTAADLEQAVAAAVKNHQEESGLHRCALFQLADWRRKPADSEPISHLPSLLGPKVLFTW